MIRPEDYCKLIINRHNESHSCSEFKLHDDLRFIAYSGARTLINGYKRSKQQKFSFFFFRGRSTGIALLRLLSVKTGNDYFCEALDQLNANEYEVACVLNAAWPQLLLFSHLGSIAWIELVQTDPGISLQEVRDAVKQFLGPLWLDCVLLVLKASPMEKPTSVEHELALDRRVTCMQRYYSNILGVTPFPGDSGECGWMFAKNPARSAAIPPPLARPPKSHFYVR